MTSRNVIRILGRYSEGLRLAAQHGPRSGVVFEYAYRNEAQGTGVLGRWIDRRFLHLSAWDTCRQRVESTKDTLKAIIAQRRQAGLNTMILDVACGSARYLRELAHERRGLDVIYVCHDRDPREVTHGRQLVASEGLRGFTFAVGDATDHSSYLTSRDPDIILATGLFPVLRDDAAVQRVIGLAFEHISPGGYFICTTIVRLSAWDPDATRARPTLRSPETIIEWMGKAGFVAIDQRFSHPGGFQLIGKKPNEPQPPVHR